MNVVLYSIDFEPITILDLPMWAIDMLGERGSVRVAVPSPISYNAFQDHLSPLMLPYRSVEIRCEWMVWKDQTRKMILTTNQDELALLLIPGWLPGQRAEINLYKKQIQGLSTLLIAALRS